MSEYNIYEEQLNISSLINAADNEKACQIGVISCCRYNKAYITSEYKINCKASSYIKFNSDAYDTYNSIYIVSYASRTDKNGYPALDSSVKIKILKVIPRNKCEYIRISDDQITLGLRSTVKRSEEVEEQSDDQITLGLRSTVKRSEEVKEQSDELYNSGRYAEFLSAPYISQNSPNNITLSYMKKALTAASRLIHPHSTHEVKLNQLQQKLLTAPQNGNICTADNLRQCCDTAFRLTDESEAKTFFDTYKKYCSKNDRYTISKNNETTQGLIERFRTFRNQLTFPLYVVAAFAQNDQKYPDTLISDLCKFIQKNCSDEDMLHYSEQERLLGFPDVLRAMLKAPSAKSGSMAENTQTLVLSIFLNNNCMSLLTNELADTCFPDKNSPCRMIIDMVNHHDNLREEKFLQLIAGRYNLEQLERAIALVWSKASDEALLRLLGWTITYCNDSRAMLEAAFSYTTIKEGRLFTETEKKLSLLHKLPMIQQLTADNPACYNLGCYIARFICEEYCASTAPDEDKEEIRKLQEEWNRFTETQFAADQPAAAAFTAERKALFQKLFIKYQQDIPHYRSLQDMYAKELGEGLNGTTAEEYLMEECYKAGAYKAYADLFRQGIKNYTDIKNTDKFCEALQKLERFDELIDFWHDTEDFTNENKEKNLVKVICGIFNTYHYSTAAFSLFSEKLTEQNAVQLLLKEQNTSNTKLITALIALYIHNEEYLKARYLYDIFVHRAEAGKTVTFSQFRELLDIKTNHVMKVSEPNHYNVIHTAFHVLPPQMLVKFLQWANKIEIPKNSQRYQPTHFFKFQFDKLLNKPSDNESWEHFLKSISEILHLSHNAWIACICECVLAQCFNLQSFYSDIRHAYELVLGQISAMENQNIPNKGGKTCPANLLPCITSYIIRNKDEQLCRSLLNIMSNQSCYDMISADNAWSKHYSNSISAFSRYCVKMLSETDDDMYSELLKLLPLEDVPIQELSTISEKLTKPGNTDYLIRSICRNYLTGKDTEETSQLISQINRSNLSYREQEAIEIIVMAYSDNSELINSCPQLCNEEKVLEFKKDCISILQEYPSYSGLINFGQRDDDDGWKRMVYSHVMGVFYSKALNNTYYFEYDAFNQSADNRVSIAGFLRKVFFSQLVYNTSFDFFYKRWRYLKLYITMVIEAQGAANDELIMEAMDRHHHKEPVLEEYYLPFKAAVDNYIRSDVDMREKLSFLYCMMQGFFSRHFEEYHSSLAKLKATSDTAVQMRKIISLLDYRIVAKTLFSSYSSTADQSLHREILSTAKAIIPSVYDALNALENHSNADKAEEIFKHLTVEGYAKCVSRMLNLEDDTYKQYADVIIPLMCSEQLPYQIYKQCRRFVLDSYRKNRYSYEQRYEKFAEYLGKNFDANAPKIFRYLDILKGYDSPLPDKAAALAEITGSLDYLPHSWQDEAEKLCQYIRGERQEFQPKRNNLDASMENTSYESRLSFYNLLAKPLGINTDGKGIDSGKFSAACEQYNKHSSSNREKLTVGITLLCGYDNNQKLAKNYSMPQQDVLAYLVGTAALEANPPVYSADERMDIAANLIGFKRESDDNKLLDLFQQLVTQPVCSIECWCRNRNAINCLITDSAYIQDDCFDKLYKNVLVPCSERMSAFTDKRISQEELLEELDEFVQQIRQMTTVHPYSKLLNPVNIALKNKIQEIKNNVRLSITFEGISPDTPNPQADTVKGRLYFCIENIGSKSVSLDKCEIRCQNLTVTLEDSLNMLHPQYVIGASAECSVPCSSISLQILYEDVILCRCSVEGENISAIDTSIEINANMDLYHTNKAVKAFGRENQLEQLNVYVTEGKALVYGPSRIGKTSILDDFRNIKRNEKLINECNPIIITFAGEAAGKDFDYEDILNTLPATDNQEEITNHIEECLLIKSITDSLEDYDRTIECKGFTQEIQQEISDILNENVSIRNRYGRLKNYLAKKEIQLWLILDEFQKIIERFEPNEFRAVYTSLNDRSPIKLIICGSDDLLRHMVVECNSVWRTLLQNRIQVKALDENPFMDMICTEPLQSRKTADNAGLVYSQQAKKALFSYTGGIPLYGKHICNQAIKKIADNGGFSHRNTVFSEDISKAAKVLIDAQATDGDIKSIFDAVKKNLDEQTDVQFLTYIAHYMNSERKIGCPRTAFTESSKGSFMFEVSILDNSLKIAEARGIVRKANNEVTDPVYTFCTVFYYYAFLGNAKNIFDLEGELFSQENIQPAMTSAYQQVAEEYRSLPVAEREKALNDIWSNEKDEDINRNFREKFRRDTIVNGDYIGGNKNMQINISIHNTVTAINTLLTGDASTQEYLDAFGMLPSLRSFIADEEQLDKAMEEYTTAKEIYLNAAEENNNSAQMLLVAESRMRQAESRMDDITASGQQSMTGAYVSTAINSPDFYNVTDEIWQSLLNISKSDIQNRLQSEYVTSLSFAVMLHNVFEAIHKKSSKDEKAKAKAEELDYCPVALMYCKVAEAMLRKLHTPIYADRLGRLETNGTPFSSFKREDGTIDSDNRKLSIGSYSHQIVRPDRKDGGRNNIDDMKMYHVKPKYYNIKSITGNNNGSADINRLWEEHALKLAIVHDIRNKSAHEARPITRKNFELLIQTLFNDGELLRIAELAEKKYPCC